MLAVAELKLNTTDNVENIWRPMPRPDLAQFSISWHSKQSKFSDTLSARLCVWAREGGEGVWGLGLGVWGLGFGVGVWGLGVCTQNI